MWLMFAGSPFKRVRPLKTIRATSSPMLNNCNHIPPPFRIAGIVHFSGHAHSESG
jgi:hypothetical protein